MTWQKIWDKRYGGTAADYAIKFRETNDNGFLLAGKTLSDVSGSKTAPLVGPSSFDFWIVKTDSLGNEQWEKDFGGLDDDHLWALDLTSDGGYIFGGSSNSGVGATKTQPTVGSWDYWVIKTDANGNVMWDKDFGGTNDDQLTCIKQTLDGGYLLGGYSNSPSGGDKTQGQIGIYDFWIVKINSLGIKQWDMVYGGTAYERLYTVDQTADKGFILAGQSQSGISGNKTVITKGLSDYWIVKTDSLGTIQWQQDYGTTDNDYLSVLTKTRDGGYCMGGHSTTGVSGDKTQPSKGGDDLWIIKVNAQGTIQWDQDLGGTSNEDEFNTITQNADGTYLMGATSYSNIGGDKTDDNLGVEQAWVFKTDSLGNKLWDKTIFTNGHNELGPIVKTKDNCYVVMTGDNNTAGGDNSQPAWNVSSDYWMVKYCTVTNPTGLNAVAAGANEITVFPDPFSEHLNIRLYLQTYSEQTLLNLYDVFGKKIISKQINLETIIETNQLSKGFYLLEVITDGRRIVKKIVKS